MVVRYVVVDVVFRYAGSPASQPEPTDHSTSCKALDSVVRTFVAQVPCYFRCLRQRRVAVPASKLCFCAYFTSRVFICLLPSKVSAASLIVRPLYLCLVHAQMTILPGTKRPQIAAPPDGEPLGSPAGTAGCRGKGFMNNTIEMGQLL